jgi:hypothetical protein
MRALGLGQMRTVRPVSTSTQVAATFAMVDQAERAMSQPAAGRDGNSVSEAAVGLYQYQQPFVRAG